MLLSMHAVRIENAGHFEGHAMDQAFHHRSSARVQRCLKETVLEAAGKHFSAREFRELKRDLEAGLVEVRIYDDGIVLMRAAHAAR
jgi:hypothetical protein